jgi:hypothetical protein
MNTRTARLSRFSAAPVCATMITAVGAWAFVNSTASGERDPFQFAAIMAANAKVRVGQTAGSQSAQPPVEVPVYTPADLLAAPPPCLGRCA